MTSTQEIHEFPWDAPRANAKLATLRKELPWLATLRVGKPNVVKIERFGVDVFERWVGRSVTCDDSYFIFGYAFDQAGVNLGTLHPTWPKSIIKKYFMMAMSMLRIAPLPSRRDLKDVLRGFPNADRIRFVVLNGHDLKHYGDLQLYIYKLPHGKTMSDLLAEYDKKVADDTAALMDSATHEVKAELHT